jgi:hypothetical protein
MPARAIRNVHINYAGQQYSGSYEATDGIVTVSSAYGSKSAAVTPKGRAAGAAILLLQIVEEYRR